ncbi:MAG: ring-opening amidohydrolase, partial [Acidobacteriota bacterium]
MKIGVHKIAMAAPNDVSGLKHLVEAGTVDPATIAAVIGKTEGNGGANDFTRGYATLSFQLLLAPYLGLSPAEVGARIAFVWSGGTEGVLSPHATIFTRLPYEGVPPSDTPRLALGIGISQNFLRTFMKAQSSA